MLERDIQRSILEYLKIKGYLCKRNQSGMSFGETKGKKWAIRMGEAGWADIIGCLKSGVFFAIEVKRHGGVVTPAQNAFLEAVRASKGVAFVAYSLEDVIARGF